MYGELIIFLSMSWNSNNFLEKWKMLTKPQFKKFYWMIFLKPFKINEYFLEKISKILCHPYKKQFKLHNISRGANFNQNKKKWFDYGKSQPQIFISNLHYREFIFCSILCIIFIIYDLSEVILVVLFCRVWNNSFMQDF